jgi:GT2 family glycosyltransferase
MARVVCVVDAAPPESIPGVIFAGTADLDRLLEDEPAETIVWLAGDCHLRPGALRELESVAERYPSDLYYSDSVEPAPAGGSAVVRRPVLSPIRLRAQDYLGGFRAFDTNAARTAGGFRAEEHAAPLDLTLRIAQQGRVLRIPQILWERAGSAAPPELVRVKDPVQGEPLVSIVIPTRGAKATIGGRERVLVLDAVREIQERSTYRHLEFIVVADDETPQAVVDGLAALGPQVRLVRWAAPFNFSAKLNRGAAFASGEYLLLLNDDVEIITADWVEVMLSLAQQPGVGLVGAALFFEDGSLQHGGHLYQDSSAGHVAFRWAPGRDDALGSLSVEREVSGVTAACALVSATTYAAVGGFSGLLPGNYNDVDFCLKIRATGSSIVWTPHARLYHFESKTRVATVAPSEIEMLRRRWRTKLLVDSYWRD